MFKFLLIISLISKIHSWTWYDYPPPRHSYYTCGGWYPSYVCDPDFMINSDQREEIVRLVEDFKNKTKRPNSTIPCMREGLRLVVALARDKIGYDDTSSGITNLCLSARLWTLSDTTICNSDLHGIELNSKGFFYCHILHWEMILNKDKYQTLNNEGNQQLNNNNHFDVLRDYIIKLQMLYIHRFSIFDNPEVSKEDKISQSDFHQPLQEGQGDITLSQLRADIEENKLKLSEMRELLSQSEKLTAKKLTLSLKFCLDAQQSSIKKFEIRLIICCLFIALMLLYLSYRIHQVEKAKNVNFKPTASKPKLQSKAGNRRVTPMQYAKFIENKGK